MGNWSRGGSDDYATMILTCCMLEPETRDFTAGTDIVDDDRPGEEGSDEEEEEEDGVGPMPSASTFASADPDAAPVPVVDAPRITIIEDE